MAAAVCEAGGIGSLPCAMIGSDKIRAEIGVIRQRSSRPLNVTFFCHMPPKLDLEKAASWKEHLREYYIEFGLDLDAEAPAVNRAPFDEETCGIVEDLKPEVVSFHFGLPEKSLLERVKSAGCKVISSATTVAEAEWLAARGCDVIIAQGYEAGGHRGLFLNEDIFAQPGTMALVPQVVDAVDVPVIAAGGIADGRGIAAAYALGASGVQIGTAYLFTPESLISDIHRKALGKVRDDQTALTNLFSGRPARGILNRVMRDVGPLSTEPTAFPTAGGALAPLKMAAEAAGSGDFTSLWSGQAAPLGHEMGAADLTRTLADEAEMHFGKMSQRS
jgi:nitronate monooxygenase